MLPEKELRSDKKEADFLLYAVTILSLIGGCFIVWFLVLSLNPTEVQRANSEEGIVDLSDLKVGERKTVGWDGKPVFIAHRTPTEIEAARSVDLSILRDPEKDEDRTIVARWLIVIGVSYRWRCILHGQKTSDKKGDYGGWYDPCRGAHYDMSGRARKGTAGKNLEVPNYKFISETELQLLPSDMAEIPKLNPSW
jgi:ubiquinol-cytochrome c reductase iron-sulfur subunit